MDKLNSQVKEYTLQVGKGDIRKAYKGILTFMSGLSAHLKQRHPDCAVSTLYPGYMDMSYFAFTPPELKDKKLKVALVYLHEEGRFEAWLSGSNRKVQAEYFALLRRRDIGRHQLSKPAAGVDAIIATILLEQPDFDHPRELREQIENGLMLFIRDITLMLGT